MIHCMVDIETLGTGRDAAILSIGAVLFKPELGWVADPAFDAGGQFYVVVDLEHSASPGTIDAATVGWWMQQSQEARDSIFSEAARGGALPLQAALQAFFLWFKSSSARALWSNGPLFDERLIREAAEREGWRNTNDWISFRASRCFRTIKALAEETGADLGKRHRELKAANPGMLKHKAIDDAVSQAMAVCEFYKILGLDAKGGSA